MVQKSFNPHSLNVRSSDPGEPRTLVVGYLVKCQKGPVILTVNEKKAIDTFGNVKCKDSTAAIKKIIVHVDRFKEIGRNLFKPIPFNNIIDYRNSIIKEWQNACSQIKGSNHLIVWRRVAKKNNLECFSSADEFNQWTMDHLKYVTGDV